MTNVPIFSPGRTNVTRSEVRIIIHLKRQYEYHLSQSYFQSFLLGVLAYLTFWIDVSNFSDRCIDLLPFFSFRTSFACLSSLTFRFMGSLTCLLVLASLMSTLTSQLPKTSYFKVNHSTIFSFSLDTNSI